MKRSNAYLMMSLAVTLALSAGPAVAGKPNFKMSGNSLNKARSLNSSNLRVSQPKTTISNAAQFSQKPKLQTTQKLQTTPKLQVTPKLQTTPKATVPLKNLNGQLGKLPVRKTPARPSFPVLDQSKLNGKLSPVLGQNGANSSPISGKFKDSIDWKGNGKSPVLDPSKVGKVSPIIGVGGKGIDPSKGPIFNPDKGPILNPGKGPIFNPDKGPVIDPGKGPIFNPDKGPVIDPSKGPIFDPDKGPIVGPGKGPIFDPDKGPIIDPPMGPIGDPGNPPPADPGNPPADPGNPPADPGNPPADPGNPPADPGNPPADPGNPPVDPPCDPPHCGGGWGFPVPIPFPAWCGGNYYGGYCPPTTVVQSVYTQAAPLDAVAQAIDLELVEVRQLDRGNPAADQGPAFRVLVRNRTGEAVAQPFTVALAASVGRVPAADSAFAAARVNGMQAGQTVSVDVRLPATAYRLGVNADGQPVPFTWLTAVADSHMEVEQVDRENDYATLNRSEVVMVALQ